MTSMTEERLKEIEEALENITTVPWKVEIDDLEEREYYPPAFFPVAIEGGNGKEIINVEGINIEIIECHVNAHLIANAPTWLREQQEEIRRLQKDLKYARSKAEEAWNENDDLEEMVIKLKQDNVQLRNNIIENSILFGEHVLKLKKDSLDKEKLLEWLNDGLKEEISWISVRGLNGAKCYELIIKHINSGQFNKE